MAVFKQKLDVLTGVGIKHEKNEEKLVRWSLSWVFHVSAFLLTLESREEISRHLFNTQVRQFSSEDWEPVIPILKLSEVWVALSFLQFFNCCLYIRLWVSQKLNSCLILFFFWQQQPGFEWHLSIRKVSFWNTFIGLISEQYLKHGWRANIYCLLLNISRAILLSWKAEITVAIKFLVWQKITSTCK